MQRYDKAYGDWVDIETWSRRRASNFEEKAGYYVQSDSLDKALAHPVTGKVHDSKSTFRRDTRNSGCVEVGNDKPRFAPTMADMTRGLPTVQQQLYEALNK
jgi:hypothetical protein